LSMVSACRRDGQVSVYVVDGVGLPQRQAGVLDLALTLSKVLGLPQRRAGIRVLDLGLDVVDGVWR
jgi:hypothetical protein